MSVWFSNVYLRHLCCFIEFCNPCVLLTVKGPTQIEFPFPDVLLLSVLSRVYQFSKRHALEECRQQVALSQGMRAKLEVQRRLLKEKLDKLGSKEPSSALKLDPDTVSLLSNTSLVYSLCLWVFLSFIFFLAPIISSVSHVYTSGCVARKTFQGMRKRDIGSWTIETSFDIKKMLGINS